ncbi:MAG: UvrD-helicase domain-containing protein, partial [Spirochaetaceae bacterium]|nr:UvrD-helicase domain-containing protein [Spirochaetaceae bacterium]
LTAAVRALVGEMQPYIERSSDPKKPVVSLVERYMWCSFYDIASREVGKRVEELKDAGGSWAYSDLIRRVSDALDKPKSPLLSLLRRRYDAALIDEFQDTDPRQWHLFHSLFGGIKHLLVLIGDPKQNIYGFRGTGLQAYRAASAAVDEEKVYQLDTNYRSRPLLVEACNILFSPLFRKSAGGAIPVGYSPVTSGKTESDVLLWTDGEIPVEFVSLSGEGRPGDLAAASYVAEIRRILDSRHGAGWRGASGEIRPVSPSDIAVLVRWIRDEEDILARLADSGIPAVRYRSRSVFAQPAAALLCDLIRAMDRTRAVSEWKGVLLGELFKLPPDLVYRFENEGRLDAFIEEGLEWRETFVEGRAVEALEAFFEFAPQVGRWAAEAGRSEVGRFLERPWPLRIVAEPGGIRTWQDWRHLTELIQRKQTEGIREPGAILAWLTESAEKPESDDGEEAVRLETESPAVRVMTMHAAKGLEFPLVFLHGGFDGRSTRRDRPDFRFDDEGTLVVDRILRDGNRPAHLAYEWEEDKRLWYVAFTRASVKVWLPRPMSGPVLQIESLLNGVLDAESALPPHQRLSLKQAEDFREKLSADLTAFTSKHFSLFRMSVGDMSLLPPQREPVGPEPAVAQLPSDIPADRDPVTSSYTSLVRAAAFGAEDRDLDGSFALMQVHEIEETLPLSSDRGALFGTLIHAVLEDCDFSLARDLSTQDWLADPRVEELLSSLSRRYYPPDWYRSRGDALKLLIRSTLRSAIPGVGRLCDLPPQDRRAEVEFLINVPREARLAMEETGDVRISGGFLKGFIDLLFRIDGRWWVADWKTNVPPGVLSADSYDQGVLRETMESHHYHLQYELYLLSLCRALSTSSGMAVNWDEDIGGAAYLFVRGMRENDERGVFVAKPEKRRMMEMAQAMGLKGVLA